MRTRTTIRHARPLLLNCYDRLELPIKSQPLPVSASLSDRPTLMWLKRSLQRCSETRCASLILIGNILVLFRNETQQFLARTKSVPASLPGPCHFAPSVFKRGRIHFHENVDIYSRGVLCLKFLSGCLAHGGETPRI